MTEFNLKEKFKRSDFRLTKPRKIIFDILENSEEHLSAEDIYRIAYNIYPAIGLTTVYRTLELLEKMGIVLKHDFGDGRARYEIRETESKRKGHHHHLICKMCHKVIDYKVCMDEEKELVKKTIEGLEKKYGFHITDHVIEFYGYCKDCYSKLENQKKQRRGQVI